ncbi:hypothetical protein A3224_15610 [Microbulbifer thermotolerans]|uniref:Uncharacterized protein n=1 Tax=Microbulbifer thermotolerans TaxID=252514 RepID=A0A143HS28_MICTH|nr:hypothetical protein A3224_15610 [Microbulbifer thermotolerans]
MVLAITVTPAQGQTPASSITNATWKQYRDEYMPSPLCAKDEIALWSCMEHQRVFSLCSSRVVTRTSGYMQYRASDEGKLTFMFPSVKRPPKGVFKYTSFMNGDASVEFVNNGYQYALFDSFRAGSSIFVTAPGSPQAPTEIQCESSQTLQVNYTMRLMYDSGVWTQD